ncbi:DUF3515 domain-containing protein [Streptomyces longispororuber]|uniref:DUF3515 domain-containing protein n=1 Tax=Streptomyces TaxID=1883 RepID=UPI0024A8525E|nr:DUF3515 domain-containing protein [Streptomyces sp. CC224B]
MNVSRRLRSPTGLSALALLLACGGCSSTDGAGTAAVPSPGAEAAAWCRDLDARLPRTVGGLARRDPEPASRLTAGWGDPAIILRCGVERPARMNDPEADGVTVNGVNWLLEKRTDGSFRFTTTLRKAYVEVTLPEERTGDGVGPLTDFAAPVRKTIPEGIA